MEIPLIITEKSIPEPREDMIVEYESFEIPKPEPLEIWVEVKQVDPNYPKLIEIPSKEDYEKRGWIEANAGN